MKPLLLAVPFLAAALLSLALTPLAKRLAVRLGAVDLPNERKVHKVPDPAPRGVAVVWPLPSSSGRVLGGLLPVPRMPEPGAADDAPPRPAPGLRGLPPRRHPSASRPHPPRRAGRSGRSSSWRTDSSSARTSTSSGRPSRSASSPGRSRFLWIVGVTNAFNLIDGLDGLSAGLAFISSVSLAGVFLIAGHIDVAVVPLALAGALLGFLRYNLHPASVFLGDSGACTVGFVLACLCLRGGTMLSAGLAVLVPVVIVGVPLADTLLSIVRRVLRAHRRPLGQRRHGRRQGAHPPQAPGPRPQPPPGRPRPPRHRPRPALPRASGRSFSPPRLPRSSSSRSSAPRSSASRVSGTTSWRSSAGARSSASTTFRS